MLNPYVEVINLPFYLINLINRLMVYAVVAFYVPFNNNICLLYLFIIQRVLLSMAYTVFFLMNFTDLEIQLFHSSPVL